MNPRVYLTFIRTAFLNMLAYRMRYYTGIMTYLLFVSVHYFIWKATFDGQPEGALINGFTLQQMVTYIAIGWVSRSLYFSDIDYEIHEIAKTGQIGLYLLRPVNFQLMMTVQAFGSCIFRALFFTVPVGVCILYFFPVSGPASAGNFFWFVVATFGAFLVLAELNFVVGLLAFSVNSIQGFIRVKYYLVQLCSGLLLPLTFFPEWAQKVLHLLPFQAISYIPLQLYLGKIPQEKILPELGIQFAWVMILAILGRYLWGKAVAKLTIQGG